MKYRLTSLFSLLISLVVYTSSAQKFTLPVLPDTQHEVGSKPEMFFSQIDWLIREKDKLKIPMVLHVGDVVQLDHFNEWEIASEGFDKLDAQHIPYVIAVGNHDTDIYGPDAKTDPNPNLDQRIRNTDKYNSYFPSQRFSHQRGRFEAGKSDNAYYTFRAGGINWLVVSLEFCPRLAAIHWAGDVIKSYPKHNVIVLTHYYLTSKGDIGQQLGKYGDFTPQVLFDKLIKKYANIRFVLSGHVTTSALKVDQGEHGNKIYQVLQDYQGEDFGGGYIRLFDFDLEKGTVEARMYSPYYNKTKEDESRFKLEGIEFIK